MALDRAYHDGNEFICLIDLIYISHIARTMTMRLPCGLEHCRSLPISSMRCHLLALLRAETKHSLLEASNGDLGISPNILSYMYLVRPPHNLCGTSTV